MLFAFDLDKTIVRNDYELPDPIRTAIHRVKDAGHLVTVLTGRPLVATTPFLELLGVEAFYSTNHGALVTGQGGEVLRRSRIDKRDATDILQAHLNRPELEFSCIVDDVLYVRDPEDERWSWAHTLNRKVHKFDAEAIDYADKIVFSADSIDPDLRKGIHANYPDFVTYAWDEGYLEVTGINADKGSALELIASELNVAREDIVAFGDGPNDVSMLKYAGHAVAVGPHAHTDVLAVADEHITSPENLGVMHWLEANVLNAVAR